LPEQTLPEQTLPEQTLPEQTLPEQTLHVRWLGRVPYSEALDLQNALSAGTTNHLLLLEHPPTYTLGVRTKPEHLGAGAEALQRNGAVVIRADRGGDVTFHGPGQLVGYPLLTMPGKRGGGMADSAAYVCAVEQVVINALADLGLPGCGRVRGLPGVWVDPDGRAPRKIAAVGVRIDRARTKHGFAINVTDEPSAWFGQITPCGLERPVTSLAAEGIAATMRAVVDAVAAHASTKWGTAGVVRADVAHRHVPEDLAPFSRGEYVTEAPARPTRGRSAGVSPDARPAIAGLHAPAERPRATAESPRLRARLDQAGVDATTSVALTDRKPEWMRVKLRTDANYLRLKETMRSLDLVTVCEEAGCPNVFECWNDGTATFMVLGERCTRACGFCLVDTRLPLPPSPDEPAKVADAVAQMGLAHAVVTMVARDDLADGGATHVAATIAAIRERSPSARVEVLVSDLKGDEASLAILIAARPDVFNHNLETVARLQRAVRPSAGYARSLTILARAKRAGLTTKSGLIVGMGERPEEVHAALVDLRAVGVNIVTIGQYLRPTAAHLPIDRWWTPAEFSELGRCGRGLGFAHVESSPLTRSSYHARRGAEAASG
jgi:lipoyl synthase